MHQQRRQGELIDQVRLVGRGIVGGSLAYSVMARQAQALQAKIAHVLCVGHVGLGDQQGARGDKVEDGAQ